MASQTSENTSYGVGSSGQKQLSGLRSSDLPSRRLIGKGLCGIVYETIWKGEKYARKDFVEVPKETFLKESSVLLGLQEHKNIVNTYGRTVDNRTCSLLLEYMDDDLLGLLQKRRESKLRNEAHKGSGNLYEGSRLIQSSLLEFIEEKSKKSVISDTMNPPPLELQEALDVMFQISMGMAFLHEQKVAHGDLKPRNILVTYSNEGVQSVKVADFGLVQTKTQSMFFASSRARKLDIAQWKAPEYLRDLTFGHELHMEPLESDSDEDLDIASAPSNYDWLKADVYSFGVTCFQILTGEVSYPNRNWKQLIKEILQDSRPKFPASFQPQILIDLLKSCWSANIPERPTFSDICIRLEEIILAEKRGSMELVDNTQGSLEIDKTPKQALDVKPREVLDINRLLPKQGQGKEGSIQVEIGTRHSGGSAQGLAEIEMPALSINTAEIEASLMEGGNLGVVQTVGNDDPEHTVIHVSALPLSEPLLQPLIQEQTRNPVLQQIENILWMKHLPLTQQNRCNEALKLWREETDFFILSIHRNRKQISQHQNQLYLVIGFYSVFQGLLFNAVAQSNLLHCNNTFTATLLSSFASFVTLIGVNLKLWSIYRLKRTNVYEKDVIKHLMKGQYLLLRRGPKFDFHTSAPDIQKPTYGEKELKRFFWWTYLLYSGSLLIFSVAVVVSIRQILCNPGHTLLPGSPY